MQDDSGRAGAERIEIAVASWAAGGGGLVLALTGAGISAESGIPTFRGGDGYWTIGSVNYTPMELATAAAFRRMPETVWEFYLARVVRHLAAEPNDGHRALVRLERHLGDDFLLVTQNVDGLHLLAGQSPQRTFRIHGDLGFVRCANDCGEPSGALPAPAIERAAARVAVGEPAFDAEIAALLRCRTCRGWLRPHVLWFDECYDEENFRWDSTLDAADRARLLVVVGTSGATNLPNQVVQFARYRGVPTIVVGLDDSPFSAIAEAMSNGAFARGPASVWVPRIVDAIVAHTVPDREAS
ncbi:MAG: RNA polymerase subunit sigma [Planctomycetes bacterium]|nr:RNA polymerase subunit sigma [Planctomycetota bacterium]